MLEPLNLPLMAIGPGVRVGPYEVIAVIGEGGMGKVWRARHAALKRDDALKVLFLDTTAFAPKYAEVLEWSALAGPSPLAKPGGRPPAVLHDYAAVARPGLLNGKWLISAAWFSGEYPPRKEQDELRGDTIAFGHYQLLDRTLFIGEPSLKPATV